MLGGIKTGYVAQNNTLPVSMSGENAYVGLSGSAIQFALSGQTNTVFGTSIFGTGNITTPNSSISYAKLSVYNSPSQGDALTYDATNGLTWNARVSGTGASARVAYWNGTSSITSDADMTFDGLNLTIGATAGTGQVNSGDFVRSSDRRIKQNIKPIVNSKIDEIKFVQYELIADSSHRTHYGVIAQDVEKIMPELVHTDKDGIKSVSYTDLLIVEVSKLQQLMNHLICGFAIYVVFSILFICALYVKILNNEK